MGEYGEVGDTQTGKQCWVTYTFIGLEDGLKEEWIHFIKGLNQGGIILKNILDSLVWS